MAGRSMAPNSEPVSLGELLVLLHGVSSAYRSVEVTYRVWLHHRRARDAFVADAEVRKRRGGSSSFGYSTSRNQREKPEPDEGEATVRIWREGEKVREEHRGGDRDGSYAVADPPLWWMWDERAGARSNQDDPTVGSAVGHEMALMLDPTSLLSSVQFHVSGSSDVAGRQTITARATPRPEDERFGHPFALGHLGTGADYYELEIDRERGVLLEASAIRDGEPFRTLATVSISFDEVIAPEVFRFEPPDGEEIQPSRGRARMQNVTLVEAQQQTAFTVLMPDRVPENWQVQCRVIGPSHRPPSPATVVVMYHSTDGHESVSINQRAADPDRPFNDILGEEGWENLTHDGVAMRARPASWGQAQVQIERDGTYVYLMSDNLTRDQIVTIAVGMRPAPDASSI